MPKKHKLFCDKKIKELDTMPLLEDVVLRQYFEDVYFSEDPKEAAKLVLRLDPKDAERWFNMPLPEKWKNEDSDGFTYFVGFDDKVDNAYYLIFCTLKHSTAFRNRVVSVAIPHDKTDLLFRFKLKCMISALTAFMMVKDRLERRPPIRVGNQRAELN